MSGFEYFLKHRKNKEKKLTSNSPEVNPSSKPSNPSPHSNSKMGSPIEQKPRKAHMGFSETLLICGKCCE